MAFVAGLIATLFLAGYLRGCRVKALVAITGAGLVLPVLVAFTSFVYRQIRKHACGRRLPFRSHTCGG